MQLVGNRAGLLLADSPSGIGIQILGLAFDLVELADIVQCLSGNLALVGGMQIEEFAAGMRQAADLGDALLREGLFVAAVAIGHQAATPLTQKGPGVFARTAGG